MSLTVEGDRSLVDAIPVQVWRAKPDGTLTFVNQRWLDYTGLALESVVGSGWTVPDLVHPHDLAQLLERWQRMLTSGEAGELEARVRRVDGEYRWFLIRGEPLHDEHRCLVGWVGTNTDIEERKRAAELAADGIRRSEGEYRQIIDAIPQLIAALSPSGQILYANRSVVEYSGLSFDEVIAGAGLFHPDDLDRFTEERKRGFDRGLAFELEVRTRHHDGSYRWFLVYYKPMRDDAGCIVRWYATGTNIDERKQAEERVRNENLALREEIDRASMFEEIVGASTALRQVLRQVAQVAPTDSTVLVTGETGTGKELVARAIHKRSQRASRAFVSVNCAAVPPSLIASELFGHERGAFTGALHRRQGKFELADGGTIFLDEVGDLSPDAQAALLRVLQERELERVGGSGPIPVDVRVIAATNRELRGAVAEKAFRPDLFYRLNVFPIEVPPLRERPADIPLLVEYLVHRLAKRAGKKTRSIDRSSLDLLRSYSWPGNVRELQNVLERAVIISDADSLTIDKTWLVGGSSSGQAVRQPLDRDLLARERDLVEAALMESNGRVSGLTGAAAKLGIPRSTLESRIRVLGVDKHRFKKR